MRKLLLGSVLIAAVSPVMAADMYTPDYEWPAYGSSSSNGWSSQYLGATLGGQRTRIDLPNGGGVLEGLGLIGGLFAGVNYDQGGLVYGVEADVDWNSLDQAAACNTPDWYCNVQGSLRARLGFAADAFHVYGTAGLATASVGGLGWTAGVGAEVAISDMLFGRLEYRYTALGSANDWVVDPSETGVTSHAVRAGIGYRF